MKELDWCPARDLAMLQRRAIRRSAWRWWLIYRTGAPIIVITDPVTAIETRRIPLNTDFTDAEFLAHDWTDETWEGGTYPPCTPGPASALAPSASGGSGRFTTDPSLCAGAGEGGGVIPPSTSGGASSITLTASLEAYQDNADTPLSEDDPPTVFTVKIPWAVPVGFAPPVSGRSGKLWFWVSPTGLDFSGVPVTNGDTIDGADGPLNQTTGPGDWSHWIYFPVGGAHYTFSPGDDGTQPITARVVLVGNDGTVLAHRDLSLTVWHIVGP